MRSVASIKLKHQSLICQLVSTRCLDVTLPVTAWSVEPTEVNMVKPVNCMQF